MVRAVIFDMDGLMIDSEPVWWRSWEIALGRRGLPVPEDLFARMAGASPTRVRAFMDELYDGSPDAIAAMDEHYEIAERILAEEGAPTKPGLLELLDWLGKQGIPCAVASSSRRRAVEGALSCAGVLGCFSAVCTGDDGLPSKPAPDIFLAAARALGVEPAAALVLEDSPTGIRAAHAGGIPCVMVPDMVQPTPEIAEMCARVCDSLLEVRDLLAQGALGSL